MDSKLILFSLAVFLAILILFLNNRSMSATSYSFLALGDSYTVAESIGVYESFPYQTIQLLRKAGHNFNAPEILARNGWTTDDLKKGIRNTVFQSSYDFVSLLIGTNDHYQGKFVNEYARNFEQLLQQAINFAGNRASHVFVLSLPDWGLTPFASNMNIPEISRQIQAFNIANKKIATQYQVNYIPLWEISSNPPDEGQLAPDNLHYSAKAYARWAQQLLEGIQRHFV